MFLKIKECWKFKESIQETKVLKKLIKKIKEINSRLIGLSKGSRNLRKLNRNQEKNAKELGKLQEILNFKVENWEFLYGCVCWVMGRLNLEGIRLLWEDDEIIRKRRFVEKFSVA